VTLLDHVERPSSADEKPKRILAGDELRRLLAAIEPEHPHPDTAHRSRAGLGAGLVGDFERELADYVERGRHR
jgi:hypothetical protein